MREWHVYHSKNGFGVSLVERPTWKYLIEGHLPEFLINPPSFLWNIAIGKKKFDEDDPTFIVNSIAGKISDLGQKIFNWVGDSIELASLPVSNEVGSRLWPSKGDWILEMWGSEEGEDQ